MDETLRRDGREGLRALMERASRPMYVRALQLTGDVRDAKQAVRRTLNEAAKAAKSGALPEEADAWCMQLVERFCDDELYYKRLIDDTMSGLDTPFTAPSEAERESVPYAPPSAPAPAYEAAPVPQKRAEPRAQAVALAAGGDEGMFAAPKKQKEKVVPNLFAEDDEDYEEFDEDDDDYEDSVQKTGGFGLALLILLLTLISAGLIWIIAIKLKTLGYINISDFGFASWFNENIFLFY